MPKSSGEHLNRRRIAMACVASLFVPGLAQAGHVTRPARRSLPVGALARTGPALAPGATAADPAVVAGIDRLRKAADTASATTGASAGPVRLIQAPGGFVGSMSFPVALAPAAGAGRDSGQAALSFLRENRTAFGWSKRGVTLATRSVRHSQGRSFVRFEQRFNGLRVFGAGAVVQVEPSGGVRFVLADLARDDAALHAAGFDVQPAIAAAEGVRAALELVLKNRGDGDIAGEPAELMVYEPSVIGETGPSRLVWHVCVRNTAGDVNEVVLVDAASGDIAFHYSDVKYAKSRTIYDHNNVRGSAGTVVRTEVSVPSGITDADLAYKYFGDTYDFYFSRFGRDSYNGAGGPLVGRVRYCEPTGSCPEPNAYWNGSEMRFGNGYAAADDVAAHELTHAVTQSESNLIYWGESGAINEALSDIFGEFVDLTNSGVNDTAAVRWLVGEDSPGGAFRNMSDPPTPFGHPDRRFSPLWHVFSDDNRGVHANSGVANKLAFLLTDGGTFNGYTVSGLGIDPVAQLFYEAQVNLLVPASDYYDLDSALIQAAVNLGWSGTARDNLERARKAVEIAGAPHPVNLFEDAFEATLGNWRATVSDFWGAETSSATWGLSSSRTAGGSYSLYCAAGGAGPAPGPLYRPLMDGWVVYGPFSLTQAQAAWAEFDLYLDVESSFDEVFWGVSVDPPDKPGGQVFDGYAVSPEPDGLTPGWVHESFNFREIESITPTLGQRQVWFAFNFQSDEIGEYEGAYIDNFVLRQSYGPTTPSLVNRYRLYSDVTKEHHYTTDPNEYDVLGTRGWVQEGIAHKAYTTNAPVYGLNPVPLYRVYQPAIRQHLWTTDSNEYSVLGTRGWVQEDIDGYVLPSAVPGVTVPLYRLAYSFLPIHLWTTDTYEYTVLATRGWAQEGIVGHVVP